MTHLVVFSHLRWNFVRQRPQHLLSRLARHHPVVYVEEPVHDAAGPARLERASPCDGVEVLRPVTPIAAAGFHDDQLSLLQPLIAGHLRERGIADPVAWLYTPMALPLLAELQPRAVIYDCIDELSARRDAPRQLHQREAALLKAAHLVLTGGPSLFEAKRALHANVACVPSAVEAQHYAPHVAASQIESMLKAEQIQGRIPGPRLGFFGVIDERLDFELLAALGDAQPDWQIVMVGPIAASVEASLPRRPNIHWLGPQPYQLLPQLVADWDVCLMPFALNDATRFLSSTTVLEYMAAEKPVVSTPVRDVVAMHGDVLRISRDTDTFIEACRWALSETAYKRAERIGEMLATVSRFSWDNAAMVVREAIESLLVAAPRFAAEAARQTPSAPSAPLRRLRPVAPARQHEHAMAADSEGRARVVG
ncbi:MAG TPA: glycosyltransferase [Albitalea sp.]|jgi:glycosyltransferase involved in cell wall biosynthesis|nr:glycosyltransferase [Albitalea sp.]